MDQTEKSVPDQGETGEEILEQNRAFVEQWIYPIIRENRRAEEEKRRRKERDRDGEEKPR